MWQSILRFLCLAPGLSAMAHLPAVLSPIICCLFSVRRRYPLGGHTDGHTKRFSIWREVFSFSGLAVCCRILILNRLRWVDMCVCRWNTGLSHIRSGRCWHFCFSLFFIHGCGFCGLAIRCTCCWMECQLQGFAGHIRKKDISCIIPVHLLHPGISGNCTEPESNPKTGSL